MSLTAVSGERLLAKLATFARLLRAGGIDVGAARLQDALLALNAIDLTSREQCYWALRCTMISRGEQVQAFDDAFASFWRGVRAEPTDSSGPRPGSVPAPGPPEPALAAAADDQRRLDTVGSEAGDETADGSIGMTFSAVERLRELDFADYTAAERGQVRALLARVAIATPRRRTRRLRPARHGAQLDGRRTLRGALGTEGYPIVRAWRRPRVGARKLLFLIDISGSMEPYARALLMFMQAAVAPGRKVEAFTFGTRLTRLTQELRSSDPDRAVEAARGAVRDWAGGTRIGENIKALNDRFGALGFTRGAVVVIVSDGWERGDTDLLDREMRRLALAAHTLVWVNPLAGEPGYEPLAVGMSTALRYVDHFLPGHNLRGLEALAEVLDQLPDYGRR